MITIIMKIDAVISTWLWLVILKDSCPLHVSVDNVFKQLLLARTLLRLPITVRDFGQVGKTELTIGKGLALTAGEGTVAFFA